MRTCDICEMKKVEVKIILKALYVKMENLKY